jgi:LysR family transcriptional regulator, hydrogen peroxide-inducible genes activator
MELHQLRYFAKVAELGHFTRAAEACGVSQPSLSQAIAKLEEEVGKPLFERLGRGVRLTEAGVKLRDRASHIVRLVDEARSTLTTAPDAGRVVVAAIPTVAPYLLPKALAAFAAACPQAEVEVIEETTDRAVGRTAAGEADLLVAALPLRHDDMHFEPLLTEELLAVLPAHHPLAEKPRISMKELSAERFILLNEAHCLSETTLAFCARRNSSPLVTARMHQLTTVLELVRLGQGVSLIPAMAAAADPSKHRVYRPVAGDKPTRTLAVGWNTRRYHAPVFGRFVEALQGAARG